ncbi:hypothetical protein NIES39_Q02960 [Arthrospira platensis NIES-39]|jgi:hypothetical protein|nr:hypothetical protein NIES39_Q02960 [Arthrospira platensis NIES-39]
MGTKQRTIASIIAFFPVSCRHGLGLGTYFKDLIRPISSDQFWSCQSQGSVFAVFVGR